jgi:hypothetical protein
VGSVANFMLIFTSFADSLQCCLLLYEAKVAIDLCACASLISVNLNIVPLGCSYVERYLDRISNGTIPDDRRSAMTELQSLVAESRLAQMSFGAMGISFLPVL